MDARLLVCTCGVDNSRLKNGSNRGLNGLLNRADELLDLSARIDATGRAFHEASRAAFGARLC